MSDNSGGRSVGRDALGILGIVVGAFSAVCVVMATLNPVEDAGGGPTDFYMSVTRFIGPIAALFAALGVALVGLRLWLRGVDTAVARHLLGIALTTFTLSILVGTLDSSLAGDFGGGIGAAVRIKFTVWVAVPTGLALVLLPAWFVWLRPAELSAARADSPSVAPRQSVPSDTEAVSAAEAEALLPKGPAPKPVPAPEPKAAKAPHPAPTAAAVPVPAPTPAPATATAPATAARPAPASPYPPDVRRTGGIPEGARPLESPYARAPQSPRDVAPVQRAVARPAADAAAGVPDANVAPVRPAAVERRSDAAAAAGPLAAAGLDAGARALPVEPAPQPLTAAPLTEAFGEEADEPAFAPDLPLEAPGHSAQPFNRTPPAPSWEQPDLFEEPVDAYGTPISLVETLRKGAASGAEVATDAGEDEAPAAVAPSARAATEADLEDVDLGDDADVESVRPLAAQPLPFDEDGEDQDDDEGGEPLAPSFEPTPAPLAAAPEAARASLFEAADEPQAEPEQDDEPAVAVVRAAAAVEVESEDSADALERDDTPFDSEEDLDDEDRDDGSGEAELETDEPEHDDLSDAEFEGHEGDGGAERAAEREPVQPSLFDALDAAPAAPAAPFPAAPQASAAPAAQPALPPEAEPELAAAPTDATAAEADEPEAPPALSDVVLKPAPRSTQRLKLPEATYRAGCLFLERNRVAVSMLQREFQMDFKVATEVLDQLQKAGLIGPYLGGQRRDILMTLDEWKEKVGVGE